MFLSVQIVLWMHGTTGADKKGSICLGCLSKDQYCGYDVKNFEVDM